MISHYLAGDPEPLIVADWPLRISRLFNALLVTGPAHDGGGARAPISIHAAREASAPPRTARFRTMRFTMPARCATM